MNKILKKQYLTSYTKFYYDPIEARFFTMYSFTKHVLIGDIKGNKKGLVTYNKKKTVR